MSQWLSESGIFEFDYFLAVTNTLLISHEGMQVKDGGHLPWEELQSPARVQVPWSNPCQPVISSRMSICDSPWHLLSHQSATQLCVLAYVEEQKSFCMSPDSLCPHPKEGGLSHNVVAGYLYGLQWKVKFNLILTHFTSAIVVSLGMTSVSVRPDPDIV